MWTRGGRTSLGCEAKAAFHRNKWDADAEKLDGAAFSPVFTCMGRTGKSKDGEVRRQIMKSPASLIKQLDFIQEALEVIERFQKGGKE